MARLQDFSNVTPSSSSDKLLIVQSAGQGLATLDTAGQQIANNTSVLQLNTTRKTLAGAINEHDSEIGTLSSLTTSDKSSLVGAVNEVNGKATTQSATFTPETGVSVMHISSGYTNKQGCISAEIRFTGSANTWKTLGTLSIKPNDSCQVIGINTGTGAPVGIVRLRNDTGAVEVYPTSSISNSAVGFSIAFVMT